jgi:hypothetical protein
VPNRDLDRLLDPAYLADLEHRPIEEVRAKREECRRIEDALSYVRRQVQGRLDIVAAEVSRRAEGKPPSDATSLIEQLPQILGHNVQAPGLGRLPTSLEPPEELGRLTTELEGILHFTSLTGLSEISDDDLSHLVDRLTDYERTVSDRRRALHDHLDALQAEIVRRYKTGEVSVESLLP